jgi:hypothetical protein
MGVPRLSDVLANESIQCPKRDYVESPPRGIGHHGSKLSAIGVPAGFVVLVLDHDCPILRLAEFAELFKLVSVSSPLSRVDTRDNAAFIGDLRHS